MIRVALVGLALFAIGESLRATSAWVLVAWLAFAGAAIWSAACGGRR